MTDYAQRASNSFNERMRLIRFRRKRENLRFWDEFKLVPRWLVAAAMTGAPKATRRWWPRGG